MKDVKIICILNNVDAYITAQCAISLIWIKSVNHAIFKVICLFCVTTFHFFVIISENLSVSNEKKLGY